MTHHAAHDVAHRQKAAGLERRAFLLGMLALGVPVRAAADGFSGFRDAFGPRFGARPSLSDLRRHRRPPGPNVLDRVLHWNEVAIDTSGVDHTPSDIHVF